MQIARIVEKTSVEGPFLRAAIWFQGCTINCPGCCNPEFQAIEGGELLTAGDLLNRVMNIHEIEGVTLLGGEPLDQAFELELFLKELKRETNLGVVLFTGYTSEQIFEDYRCRSIAALCDLIIAGPFVKEQTPDRRMWIGSKNQKIIEITDRYKDLCQSWPMGKLDIEICISDGEISFNGTPLKEFDELNEIFSKTGGRN